MGKSRDKRPAVPSKQSTGSPRGSQRTGGHGDGQRSTAQDQRSSPTQTVRRPTTPVVSQQTIGSTVDSSNVASSSSTQLPMDVMTARRPGCGMLGKGCRVAANHFQVKLAKESYYFYTVSIDPLDKSKWINRNIIRKLVIQYAAELENRMPAYDGRERLYTAGPLPFEFKEFIVNILKDADADADADAEADTDTTTNAASSSNSKKKSGLYTVQIKYSGKGDFDLLREFLENNQLNSAQEIIQALDVVLRTNPTAEYTVVGRSFFSDEFGNGNIGQSLVHWKGYYQSLRAVQLGFSLNVDMTATAFYDSVDLITFITDNLEIPVFPEKQFDERERSKVTKALNGLRVEVTTKIDTNEPITRMYKITGLSSVPLSVIKFVHGEAEKTVSQYFQTRYKIRLAYPTLPAIQVGSNEKPIYLPVQLCVIVAGQKYNKKLNNDQVKRLMTATFQTPIVRVNAITRTVEEAFANDLLVRDEFGISVGTKTVLDARVLPAPTLLYKQPSGRGEQLRPVSVLPYEGKWNITKFKKLFDGGSVDAWACIVWNTNDKNIAQHFCDMLIKVCISRGMRFKEQPVIPIRQCNPNAIEEELRNVGRDTVARLASNPEAPKQIQLLIVIIPKRSGLLYGEIKRLCETELGIVSQCCQSDRLFKGKFNIYLENVALKINVKVGGRNTILSDETVNKIPQLKVPTIIFGADVNHPHAGDDASPSIAAVVASMDWPGMVKYRGLVSAQQHRQEIIQDLYKEEVVPDQSGSLTPTGMIRKLLLSFLDSNEQKPPKRIIFYRDGVSDGQFRQVLVDEVSAIRKACASLWSVCPPVTFIVVQKRHHTRFFRVYDEKTNYAENVSPGTVVDTDICHPFDFDFYLNSHAPVNAEKSNQGTNRPAHYQVLVDENHFSSDQLQELTNDLCYTYARCTRALSIVPPAYYADLLAFRARYYIQEGEYPSDVRGVVVVRPLPAIRDEVKDLMFFC